MHKLITLAATAALALFGLGTVPAAAGAAQTGTSQVQTTHLNEILINTTPALGSPQISAVELVKPTNQSINGYRIQVCDSAGTLTTVTTISDTNADNQTFVVAANTTGYDYGISGSMFRDGGVRLADGTNVVHAVTFDAANTALIACLGGNPDEAPAPTDTQSAQLLCDTGPWALAPPTLGAPNFCL